MNLVAVRRSSRCDEFSIEAAIIGLNNLPNQESIIRLINQAKNWTDHLPIDNQGYGLPELELWQKAVQEELRSYENSRELVLKFIRLQQYANYTWLQDMGNLETRTLLWQSVVSSSIQLLENLIRGDAVMG